eukprot:CAMPEP_0170741476 /NCGR_PEP_ID=MMETSP0437-20130122/6239_1 /TAXON_ID=0 /ORGANISM="Sexangularia sp." /LENGTH=581 /DNA_ID=CAMNT_0011080049 /DNA_START=38 /DNA_END=1783 /DNA_ORIENTATION=-
MSSEPLSLVQILIDELKADDISARSAALAKLPVIAGALGPARTRSDLLPFLADSLDDEDEFLLELAAQLTAFAGEPTPIGGAAHLKLLLPTLEALASAEDANVRKGAVSGLRKAVSGLSSSDFDEVGMALVNRLADSDWFTSKSSAAGLISAVYPRASSSAQSALRSTFASLSSDDMPMVRRAAAAAVGGLATAVKDGSVVASEIIPVYQRLTGDDQDSVRLLAVDAVASFSKVLSSGDRDKLLVPIAQRLATDKSWRVRYTIANQFERVCEALGPEVTKTALAPAFVKLLKDNEAEVRTAAAKVISPVAARLEKAEVIADVVPCLKALTTDGSQHVRAGLASSITGLAPQLGKEDTVKHLQDLFLELLKDDFPDVRLNVISNIEGVNKVLGIGPLQQSLLPAVMTLAEDKNWRVRLQIIEFTPVLAAQLGQEFFDNELSNVCLTWLGDRVFEIRKAAALILGDLADAFGLEWTKSNLIPKVGILSAHPNYLYRMTTLFAVSALAPKLGKEAHVLLPIAVKLTSDTVPNVRFNAALALAAMIPVLESGPVEKEVRPVLTTLCKDSDGDVTFRAKRALALIK